MADLNKHIRALQDLPAPDSIWDAIESTLTDRERSLALIRTFYASLEEEPALHQLSEDFQYQTPLGTYDLKAFGHYHAPLFRGKELRIEQILLDGHQAVVRYSIPGTALTDTNLATDWLTLNHGKIQHIRSYFDAAALSNKMIG